MTGADELTRLIETLHETHKRIRELTAGSVDAVTHPSGASYLLSDAQSHLRASEAQQRRHANERAAILDAIPSHLALLDEAGHIVAVNESWRRFATTNGLSDKQASVGENYLDVCERATGEAAEMASEVASRLRAVLSGHSPHFTLEYPCHAPGERRWFHMTAVPIPTAGHGGALVIHRNITDQKTAELRLDATTRLLRLAGRMARVGGWSCDFGDNLIEWSDEIFEMHEMEPGPQVTTEQAIAFFAPEWRDRFAEVLRACAHDGTPYDEEFEIVTARGDRRWIRTIGEAVRDDRGRIVGARGTFQDITEQKSAEAALMLSKGRFRQFADALPQIVWTADPDGTVDFVNRAFYEAVGTSEVDLQKGEWLSFLHPDDQDRVQDHWSSARRSGTDYAVEFRLRNAGGEYRWHLVTAKPIRDASGAIIKWYGAALDDHDRRTAERENLRLAERLNRTFESISDGFYTLDRDWRFTFVNTQAERLMQRDRRSLLGRVAWDVFDTEATELLRPKFEKAMSEGVTTRIEFFHQRLNTWFDGTVFPSEEGLAIYFRNVTERHALEEQLRQAQRLEAVGQLTGGVAHDFNNLLTVILGNAETLVDDLGRDSPRGELAAMVKTAAERGAELTASLLAFARRQPLDPRPVDVNRMISSMDPLLRRTLGEQIEIENVRGGGLWPALVDPPQLESAVLNLCLNARDAMVEGGKLTIETSNVRLDDEYASLNAEVTAGQYVMLAVSDTGTGMTSDVVERAFEPFFTTKTVGKGSGLGLSMVYGFAKQSAGHVKIYSELGQGTTIKLYLPRAPTDAEEATADQPVSTMEGFGETILVVEDNALVRDHVAAQLRNLGYQVLTAQDGVEALNIVRSDRTLDLLFTDVVMPGGMNGRELADTVRSIRPQLPVLFTSGYTENAIIHHGRLDPGAHLLQKPYRRQQLAAKIRQVLADT